MSRTTLQGPRDWSKVFGADPARLLKESVPVPEHVYIEEMLKRSKSPLKRGDMERFEGEGGCVAWAWRKDGRPELALVDKLGQPVVKADFVLSWNPSMRTLGGRFYDFLAYSHSSS